MTIFISGSNVNGYFNFRGKCLMNINTAVDASSLCQDCGLCCNGALFSYAQVSSDEKERVEKLGFKIYERSRNKFVFDSPCPKLENSKCTIYQDRPKKCVGYFCRLAKNVVKGAEGLTQAQEIVSSAKREYNWLIENAPNKTSEEKNMLNLRDFLQSFIKIVQLSLEEEKLEAEYITYVERVFEFLKIIDANFRETSLLTKYASLLQTIHFKRIKLEDSNIS